MHSRLKKKKTHSQSIAEKLPPKIAGTPANYRVADMKILVVQTTENHIGGKKLQITSFSQGYLGIGLLVPHNIAHFQLMDS